MSTEPGKRSAKNGTPATDATRDATHDGAPTSDRRRNTFIAIVAILAILAFIVTVLVWPHDDKDGPSTKAPTKAETQAANDLREDILANINVPSTAKNPTTEALITPSGKDWWKMATSVAYDTQLWNAPAPKANWYAVTTTRSYKSLDPDHSVAHAVHIAFPTADDATAYLDDLPDSVNTAFIQRDGILTATPAGIDPYEQPWPKPSPELDKAANTKAPVASWVNNVGATQRLFISENKDERTRDTFTDIYTNLGFTKDTTWAVTASNAQGPWVGQITDYNTEAIDAAKVRSIIEDNQIVTCEKLTCIERRSVLDPFLAATAWYAPNPEDNPEPIVEENPDGTEVSMPQTPLDIPIANDNNNFLPVKYGQEADALLHFGIHSVGEQTALTGDPFTYAPPVPIIRGSITADPNADSATSALITLDTTAGKLLADWQAYGEDDEYWHARDGDMGPDDSQTGTARPTPTKGQGKGDTQTEEGETSPGYSFDENGNVVPDNPVAPPKPPKSLQPLPPVSTNNIPMPPIPTTIPDDIDKNDIGIIEGDDGGKAIKPPKTK